MCCSCSHALHLVSLIILQNVLNKTTIKILWQEHEKHDEQICTPQCYITLLSLSLSPLLFLSLSLSVFFCTVSPSFFLGHGALCSISGSPISRKVNSRCFVCFVFKVSSGLFCPWHLLPTELSLKRPPGKPYIKEERAWCIFFFSN